MPLEISKQAADMLGIDPQSAEYNHEITPADCVDTQEEAESIEKESRHGED